MIKRKLTLGDVLKIETSKGIAYIQYVQSPLNSNEIEMTKVFYKLHSEPICINDKFISDNENDFFFLSFPVKAAEKKGILNFVDNVPLNKNFQAPIHFRTENPFGKGWNIVDKSLDKYVETGLLNLTEEQKKLSPWGVWNDTLLAENLENGWRLENWI